MTTSQKALARTTPRRSALTLAKAQVSQHLSRRLPTTSRLTRRTNLSMLQRTTETAYSSGCSGRPACVSVRPSTSSWWTWASSRNSTWQPACGTTPHGGRLSASRIRRAANHHDSGSPALHATVDDQAGSHVPGQPMTFRIWPFGKSNPRTLIHPG